MESMTLKTLNIRSLLACTISLQMALMAPVQSFAKIEGDEPDALVAGTPAADTNNSNSPTAVALQSAIGEIEKSSFEAPPTAKNIALIARQERWVWNEAGTQVEKVYDLGNVDISMPEQSFYDAKTQLEIEYVAAEKRLLIHRVKPVKGANVKSDTHVWNDIELTAPIYMDSHFIYLATTQGVRFIAVNLLKRDGFNKIVPALRATRALPPESGLKIVKVGPLSRATEPRAYQELDGSESPVVYLDGDLALEVAKVDSAGQVLEVNPVRVAQDQVMNFALEEYLAVIALILTRSPQSADPNAIKELAAFFDLYSAQLKEKNREIVDLMAPVNYEHDDLLIEAVSSLAQRSGLQNHIQSYQEIADFAGRKRDQFNSDPSPQGQWAQDYQKIVEARARLSSEGKANDVPWDAIVASQRSEALQSYVATQTRSEQTRRGQLFNAAGKLWGMVSSPKALKILAATLAGTYAAGAAGLPVADQIQIWMTSSLSTIWSAITTSPATPQDFKEALTSLPKFLKDGGSFTMWLAGGALFSSAYFLLIGMVDAYKRVAALATGKPVDKIGWTNSAKSLLVTMTKGYLLVNRVMELPWKAAKQANLYTAMDNDIPLTQSGVFNLPRGLVSDDKIAENTQKLNEFVKDRTLLNALATRFAAAMMISEKNHIDVATLFQEEKHLDEATANMVTTNDPALRTEYFKLSAAVHAAAADILKNQDIKLNIEDLQKSYEFYDKIAKTLKEKMVKDPSVKAIIKTRLLNTCATGARNLFVYLLGGSGRDIYNKFYNAQYSDEAVKIGTRQGLADFTGSMIIWWGASPASFASFEGRVQAGVAEQLSSWTSQVLPDVAPSLLEGHEHADGRIGAQLHDPKREEGPKFVRSQTLSEALSIVLKGLLDTRAPKDKGFKDPLETWQQYIVNLKNGMWVRILFAGVPLYLLQFLPATESVATAATTALAASLTTVIYILLSKFAIRGVGLDNNYSAGVDNGIVGYSIVWPIATSIASMPKVSAANNLRRIQAAVGSVMEGVELNKLDQMQSGVRDLKGLYENTGIELPIELNVDSANYDNEKALKLVSFSMKKVPLPTQENSLFDHILNVGVGSVISVVLFNNIQEPLVKHMGPGLVDLAGITGFLIASYAAVSLVRKVVVNPILKVIDKEVTQPVRRLIEIARPTCQSILGRDPVNTR
jgi:hypothetical protein